MFKFAPAVFAVADSYQIMVPIERESLFWVEVAGKEYYDESNGIMRSLCDIHRACVPQSELDAAKKYTVCIRPLIERKPYFTQTAPVERYEFVFYPVPKTDIRAYHISDAHNLTDQPVAAAEAFGKTDMLILNGGVIDHSGDPSKFTNIYDICSRITHGNVPTVFSRGNHDMRGNYAEKFAEYTPNHLGNTFYTFRLGTLWGVLLDCGEDKDASSDAYGYTVSCHAFRQRQTEFLKKLIANAEREYAAEGVTRRVVISHNPFTQKLNPPFDIEENIYKEWARLLRDSVHPHLMICGHLHKTEIHGVGGEWDHYGQPCPVVIGANISSGYYVGCGYVFGERSTEVTFTGSDGKIFENHVVLHGE